MRKILVGMCLATIATATPSRAEWPIETNGTLGVMNKRDNTVTLIDLATGKESATLPTGIEPHEGAASPDGGFIVISNTNYNADAGHTLTVINVEKQAVEKTIALDGLANPHGIAFLPGGHRVVLTAEGSEAIAVVDVREGKVVSKIDTPGFPCHMVVPSRDGRLAWATSISKGTLIAVDLDQGKMVGKVGCGNGSEGFDLSPDEGELWVGNRADDSVSIVDAESMKVTKTLAAAGFPIRVKFALGGAAVLVSCAKEGVVRVFDRKMRRPMGEIQISETAAPIGIQVAPDGIHAFVAATQANRVTLINVALMRVAGTVEAGNTPDGMACAVSR